jgi:hypothetical protein
MNATYFLLLFLQSRSRNIRGVEFSQPTRCEISFTLFEEDLSITISNPMHKKEEKIFNILKCWLAIRTLLRRRIRAEKVPVAPGAGSAGFWMDQETFKNNAAPRPCFAYNFANS